MTTRLTGEVFGLTCAYKPYKISVLEPGNNVLDLPGVVGRTAISRGLRDENKENTLTKSGDNPM